MQGVRFKLSSATQNGDCRLRDGLLGGANLLGPALLGSGDGDGGSGLKIVI